ncbi:MAG TPA: hypothetical protein PLM53_13015 [Spirochaetota bacterium]|nr:hypothetical protein [Spirochaetota bacterium]HPC40721.1 hypothetical protein [Spirochaetota bacterium]HPL18936.1 hypothetical protein [Spirochaetota bacterium]HQF09370.1 hypothetical protein [Spirochaetota bacterium]HQH98016.1 hypothetical protein [Spirochaetota bacterium]
MKRLITLITIFVIISVAGVLHSTNIGFYQVVEVFICEQELVLAEMIAKTSISRQELTTVSYCTCDGVDPSMKVYVKKNKCEPPKDMVYACTCIGKTHY